MDNIGFVLLAYGIAVAAILFYTAATRKKIARLRKEIQEIESALGNQEGE